MGSGRDTRVVAAGRAFGLTVRSARRLGTGHINETFVADTFSGTWVLQRVNTSVFARPTDLAANLALVSAHLTARGVLTPQWRSGSDGDLLVDVEDDGGWWRCYRHVPGRVQTTAGERVVAARALGRFAGALADLAPADLHDTIPDFHDLPRRRRALGSAVEADPCGRGEAAVEAVATAVELVERLDSVVDPQSWAALPRRVAHNDAKLDNVVLTPSGRRSEPEATVIDLDTVMAGTVLADVGELVRSATKAGGDDTPGPTDVEAAVALVDAWLAGWNRPLDPTERALVPVAGAVLATENAVRFLTDHLLGDVYFAIHRPAQNLDRFRVQHAHAHRLIDAVDDLVRHVGT